MNHGGYFNSRVTINIHKNNKELYNKELNNTIFPRSSIYFPFLFIPYYVVEVFLVASIILVWLENQGKRVLRIAVNNCKN